MKKSTTGAFIALMVLATSIVMVGSAVAAPLPGQAYSGNAYGSFANIASTVQSGRSAPVGLPCAPPVGPGYNAQGTVAGVNVAGLLTTGAVNTTMSTGPATGAPQDQATSDVANVSALGGLVTVNSIKSVSTTLIGSSGYNLSGVGSAFAGLKVLGLPMLLAPPPNTTIALPGVGKVVLNEHISRNTATGASMTVNMIHITVSIALPGIPAGTQIIVGHSTSGMTNNSANSPTLVGGASGAEAHIGSLVTAGQEFAVSMCGSTNGKTNTNSAASTNIAGIVTTGTVANTVNGTLGSPTSTAVSTSTIQNLNLLSGLIKVDAIKSQANASLTAGTDSLNETGSTFLNLVLNGQAMPANPAPNTKISLGGLTIWFNRVFQTKTGITVRAIEITVAKANDENLPIGSDIQVASATAAAYPFPTS